MTIRSLAARFREAGIAESDAVYEARLLAAHFTGASISHLTAFPDEELDISAAKNGLTLERAAARRTERYPLQYIIGEWEFYGLTFSVNESTLIPRPDTECIAECAINCCRNLNRSSTAVLDLCTGSGCIAAAILANVPLANVKCTAVDLYPDTLQTARRNLHDLGLDERCTFIEGDATTDLFAPDVRFDVIVSNPPYITADEMNELEPELSYEPRHALTDGCCSCNCNSNGLSIIKKIIEIYRAHLSDGGVMIIEHGSRQSSAVQKIAADNGLSAEVIRDYGGNLRGVKLHK